LTEPQRQWLVTHQPATIGSRDGIPAADRDAANRLLLETEYEGLLQLRSTGVAGPELSWIDGQLRGIVDLRTRLAGDAPARAYLLRFSAAQDGRAVVAVGNPDHATDVLTYVPGAGSALRNVGSLVQRADEMARAATEIGPDHQVAVIAWLGYDAPDGAAAALTCSAEDAEAPLRSFTDGLRITHDGGTPSHNTVLGHSYGSLVAGVTARDRGLDADDLVFVGSPGVGVLRAEQLHVSGGRVWSSTAADDPVQHYAPGAGQIALDMLANAARPFSAHYGDAQPDVLLWHGLNPSVTAFGARVFASDPDGGHSGYWQGAGLQSMARIAVGAAVG
jgi:hypothetical protein